MKKTERKTRTNQTEVTACVVTAECRAAGCACRAVLLRAALQAGLAPAGGGRGWGC